MKALKLVGPVLAGFGLCAHAALYSGSWSGSALVPDGTTAGWSSSIAIDAGTDIHMTSVSVTLNISGGFNGDLYAYLSHDGVLVPLLNRVGVTSGNAFGYANSGFNVTLRDGGAGNQGDIHWYGGGGAPAGIYEADGRTVDPLASPGAFDSSPRVNLGAYNFHDPNGSWTIFFADLSSGEQSTITGWSLNITAIPEPVNVALGLLGGVCLALGLARMLPARGLAPR